MIQSQEDKALSTAASQVMQERREKGNVREVVNKTSDFILTAQFDSITLRLNL